VTSVEPDPQDRDPHPLERAPSRLGTSLPQLEALIAGTRPSPDHDGGRGGRAALRRRGVEQRPGL